MRWLSVLLHSEHFRKDMLDFFLKRKEGYASIWRTNKGVAVARKLVFMSVCWVWVAFCNGSLFYSASCYFNGKWGILSVQMGEALPSVCWTYSQFVSVCLHSHYVDNQKSCTSLPQISRPTLQPFISLFYLQKLSIKATGKTALTTDIHLQVWPFQELNTFLNVHCFFYILLPCANMPQS